MDKPNTSKTTFLVVIIILLAFIISYLTIITIEEENEPGPEETESIVEVEGKDVNKEEYIYKDDLLDLGYSVDEIKLINEKITDENVKKYLLEKKYNNLSKFLESENFNVELISRYQSYYDSTDYTETETVLYVNIGIDNEFYTNTKEADQTEGTLILVNKYNYVTEDYVPTLSTLGDGYGKGKLQVEAAIQFRKMVDAAKEDGITLKSVSAYRSYASQKSIYNSYVKKDGQTKADTYSARPGHSEHNTGLAVDINTSSSSKHFENTEEYTWLINNSYKYGFILRYPEGKQFITGYKFEPWHYRYLNVEVATKIHDLNITYEEYLVTK